MGWEEIDLNKIQSGMITGGGLDENENLLTEVSFADYLNVFSRALDERYNMVAIYPLSTQLELPNITFEAGEIRNDTWWNKYKNLLESYWGIYRGSNWYKTEVLQGDNRANIADFLISDSDIIEQIGQVPFDILNNLNSVARYDMFRADVINALYILYEYLTLRLSTKSVVRDFEDQQANRIQGFDFTNNRDLLLRVFGSGSGTTSSAAISDVYSPPDEGESKRNEYREVSGSIYVSLGTFSTGLDDENENPYRANADYINGNVSYLYSKDLEGNKLDMDYYPCNCIVEENYLYSRPQEGEDAYIFPPYEPDLPFVGFGFTTDVGIVEPIDISQTSEGTRHFYQFGDSNNLRWPPPPFPSSNGSIRGEYRVRFPEHLIDVNNSALEFSI